MNKNNYLQSNKGKKSALMQKLFTGTWLVQANKETA